MTNHNKSPRSSPEVRNRAVRMVFEHRSEHTSQWAAIASIAAKIGCSAQTLSNWVKQAERDSGAKAGPTTDERERLILLKAVGLKPTGHRLDEGVSARVRSMFQIGG